MNNLSNHIRESLLDATPEDYSLGNPFFVGMKSITIDDTRGWEPERILILPEGLEDIAASAFAGKYGIEEVYLPSTLRKIGEGAFGYMPRLRKVQFTSTKKTYIENEAFGSNPHLEEVVFSRGGYSMKNLIFASCGRLKSMELPENLTKLGTGTFMGCDRLGRVEYKGTTLDDIPAYTFMSCINLKEVVLSKSILTIGRLGPNSFAGCTSLQQVIAPGVGRVGWCAFDGCKNLKKVKFSKNVYLDNASFRGCSSLKSVGSMLSDFVVENAFKGCDALEEISWDGIGWLPFECFFGLTSLKKVEVSRKYRITNLQGKSIDEYIRSKCDERVRDKVIIEEV